MSQFCILHLHLLSVSFHLVTLIFKIPRSKSLILQHQVSCKRQHKNREKSTWQLQTHDLNKQSYRLYHCSTSATLARKYFCYTNFSSLNIERSFTAHHRIPLFYSLSKVHKTLFTLRLIINTSNSLPAVFSIWLDYRMKDLLPLVQSHIKNSTRVIEETKSIRLPKKALHSQLTQIYIHKHRYWYQCCSHSGFSSHRQEQPTHRLPNRHLSPNIRTWHEE